MFASSRRPLSQGVARIIPKISWRLAHEPRLEAGGVLNCRCGFVRGIFGIIPLNLVLLRDKVGSALSAPAKGNAHDQAHCLSFRRLSRRPAPPRGRDARPACPHVRRSRPPRLAGRDERARRRPPRPRARRERRLPAHAQARTGLRRPVREGESIRRRAS